MVNSGRPIARFNHSNTYTDQPDTSYKIESINVDGLSHHVVWIWNGSVMKLYIDNVYKFTYTPTVTFSNWNAYTTRSYQLYAEQLSIQQIRYYPVVADSSAFYCERAYLSKSCHVNNQTAAIVSKEARQALTTNIPCATSSVLIYDTKRTLTSIPTTLGSISFWITSNLYLNAADIEYINLVNSMMVLSVSISNTGGARLKISLCGLACDTFTSDINADIVNDQAHFYTIVYDGTTMNVYMDGSLFGSKSNPTRTTGGSTSLTVASITKVGVASMIKVHPNAILTASQVLTELQCQLNTNVITSFHYQPPVGYCTIINNATVSNNAYCRTPLMCNGHCAALATFNTTTSIFVPSRYVCDDGWALPDCTTRCKRVDVISGQCLDLLDESDAARSTQVANGQWCTLMKFYKIYTVLVGSPPVRTLVLEPRRWLYQASVTVPEGEIISVVGNGGCPITTFQAAADGGIVLEMKNEGTEDSNVLVLYGSPEQINGDDPCLDNDPCCNVVGTAAIVPARGVFNAIRIGDCGNVTMRVYLNTIFGPTDICSDRNAESINAEIGSASTEPAFVVSHYVNTQVNQALQQTYDLGVSSQASILTLMVQGALLGFQSEAFAQLLDAEKYKLANGTSLSIAFNNTYLKTPTVLGSSSFDDLLAANSNRSVQIAAIDQKQVVLDQQFEDLQNTTSQLLEQQQVNINNMQETIAKLAALANATQFNFTFSDLESIFAENARIADEERAALGDLVVSRTNTVTSNANTNSIVTYIALIFSLLSTVGVGVIVYMMYAENASKYLDTSRSNELKNLLRASSTR
jgi:hypothetical protein